MASDEDDVLVCRWYAMRDDRLTDCTMCPRSCHVNRYEQVGVCGCHAEIRVARAALHFGEEPCISGIRGSGAVFFSGCSMGCVFCQNDRISHKHFGREISVERLADIYKELENAGAHNINLISPSHFSVQIIKSLDIYKPTIPIIYNSSGYETIDAVKSLDGYVDVYLPDIKYADENLAMQLSKAHDYPRVSMTAVREMISQVGYPKFDDDGMIQRGVIIRHLILPGHTKNSEAVLNMIASEYGTDAWVSLMNQYTPVVHSDIYEELNRQITKRESEKVEKYMMELGLHNGYVQDISSQGKGMIPDFDLTGV